MTLCPMPFPMPLCHTFHVTRCTCARGGLYVSGHISTNEMSYMSNVMWMLALDLQVSNLCHALEILLTMYCVAMFRFRKDVLRLLPLVCGVEKTHSLFLWHTNDFGTSNELDAVNCKLDAAACRIGFETVGKEPHRGVTENMSDSDSKSAILFRDDGNDYI